MQVLDWLLDWLYKHYPLALALGFTVLAVLFKLISRREGDTTTPRNEFYVCQSLLLASISGSFGLMIRLSLASLPVGVPVTEAPAVRCILQAIGYLCALTAMSYIDRRHAWRPTTSGGYVRKMFMGLVLPNIVGVAGIFNYFNFARTYGL
jgi:hypothetical protein